MDTSVGQGSQVQGSDILQSDQSRMEVGTDIDFEQCPECFLKSWRNQRCYFCDDFCSSESAHRNNTQPQQHEPVEPHISFATAQQPPAQAFRDSIPCTRDSDHHGTQEGRLARATPQPGRDRSRKVDNSTDQGPTCRDQGREQGQPREYPKGEAAETTPSKPPQGKPDGTLEGLGHSGEPQSHHLSDGGPGRGGDSCTLRARGQRVRGIWEVWGQDVSRGVERAPELCVVGPHDEPGERQPSLASSPVCSMAATAEASESLQRGQHCNPGQDIQQGRRQCGKFFRGGCQGLHPGERTSRPDSDGAGVDGAGTNASDLAEQDSGSGGTRGSTASGEGHAESHGGQAQEPEGDVRDQNISEAPLSEESALTMAKIWHLQRNPFSQSWQTLVWSQRPLLVELACYPNSILSTEVERRFGQGSAFRLSDWNGANLETQAGVELAKRKIRQLRPVHLWISCDCAPFCPLQAINRRNPEQAARLDDKQEKAKIQYRGAIEVAEAAWKVGTEVHWELSQRCQAWHLDFLQDYEQRHGLKRVSCNGCTVGLRTRDNKTALCKAWTITTKNKALLQHLDLRCQKNHPKGRCERGETAHTARYTSAFTRKVVDSLTECEVWSRIIDELHDQQPHAAAQHEVQAAEQLEIPEAERKEIIRKIQRIHCSTGHSNMSNLIKALELRAAHPKVLQVAREWKCTICEHRHRKDPRHFATLETIPQKWERLQVDMFTWMHPHTKEKQHVLVMIDEATRFRMTRIASTGKGNKTTWEKIKGILEEQWFAIFGYPKVIRCDPGGPWMSDEADRYFGNKGIEYVTIPGESHWQIGLVEGATKTLKGVAEKLSEEFPEMEATEVIARSTWVCNNEEQYRGYTPLQQVLGRAPDEYGRFFEDPTIRPVHPGLLDDGGFKEDIQARMTATQAFAEEIAKRRLERAQRSGTRRVVDYVPGDLVYYWRNQVPLKDKTTQSVGRFLGPARVLATETRKDSEGNLRPGSIVWLHRAGRLLRAAPEQLRPASSYEQQLETLKGPVELPWTITSIATDPKRRTFLDISQERPTEGQWEQAAELPIGGDNSTGEAPTRRHTEKGPLVRYPQDQPRGITKEDCQGDHNEPSEVERLAEKKRKTMTEPMETEDSDWEMLPAEPSPENPGGPSSGHRGYQAEIDMEAFYAVEDNLQAIEVHIDMPTSKRGWKKFSDNPEAYICSMMRKKQLEVNEKKLTKEEVLQFIQAKQREVRNFVASECFEAARKHVDESKVVGMRWLLSWKIDDDNNKKAKARAIVLGYQDPRYSERPTAAPTPSRAGRQLFLQMTAWRQWVLEKGDISGAFLQGDDLEEEIWCRPVKEITQAYGLADDSVMLMKKAAYGLVQAPLHWHKSVNKYLQTLGYRQLEVEPCCWIWTDKAGVVRSAVHAHVDDFLFAGAAGCAEHQGLIQALKTRFKWGTWESQCFVQCGIEIQQNPDYSIDMRQSKFINDLEEIRLSRDRSRVTESPTTDHEKTMLRGALGSLSWLTGQTVFIFAVDVNILLTKVPTSTVSDINETNKLIRHIKKTADQVYRVHAFDPKEELELAVWTDAAHANRPNGLDSTEGIFVGMTTRHLREGQEARVTAVHWRSGKIDRICRSPASAECMAGLDGEDDLTFLRFLWAEMQGKVVNTRDVDSTAKQVKGLFITDAKNLFDKLVRATPSVKGAEKRSGIEAMSLRQNLLKGDVEICWVDGGGMLANVLTKTSEKGQGWLYLQLGQRWRIRHDEVRASQKKRRAAGLKLVDIEDTQHTHPPQDKQLEQQATQQKQQQQNDKDS